MCAPPGRFIYRAGVNCRTGEVDKSLECDEKERKILITSLIRGKVLTPGHELGGVTLVTRAIRNRVLVLRKIFWYRQSRSSFRPLLDIKLLR